MASFSYPTDPSGSVRGNRLERLDGDGDADHASGPPRQRSQPAFFVFTPQRSLENRWATSVSHVEQTTQWSSSGTGSNMLIAIMMSDPIGRLGIFPRALRPDPERTLVASDRMARFDVKLPLRIGSDDTVAGRARQPPPKMIVTTRCSFDLEPRFDRLPMPIKHTKCHVARYQPPLSWRAAASAVSSGCVLNAMAALGAALWTAFTTISNSGKLFGGSLRPPPITTQS